LLPEQEIDAPLDRARRLLYISPEHLTGQPFTLTLLPDMDALGNWVNGLDQINCKSLYRLSPNNSSPIRGLQVMAVIWVYLLICNASR